MLEVFLDKVNHRYLSPLIRNVPVFEYRLSHTDLHKEIRNPNPAERKI